jgi:hypothetical protein
MKIYFERSGGFMGRSVSTVIDTNEIPPEKALKLLEIIEEIDFFEWSESYEEGRESTPTGADTMCYRVTLEVAGTQHTIETSDTSTPGELEPLIQELDQIARQSRH